MYLKNGDLSDFAARGGLLALVPFWPKKTEKDFSWALEWLRLMEKSSAKAEANTLSRLNFML
jgi:hypothetical protein